MGDGDAVAARLTEVKRETARRITALAPEWKQRNLAIQAAEQGLWYRLVSGRARKQRKERRTLWSRIDAVRAASDRLEAAIADLPTGQLRTLDVAAWSGWPD